MAARVPSKLQRPPKKRNKVPKGLTLVTGATGHLGANLVRRLLEDGHRVRALVRPLGDHQALDGLDLERFSGDVRDLESLRRATEGCARIFHCAAMISTIEGDDQHRREIFETNVLGTRKLLQAARENKVGRVVVTGSLSAVGHDPDDPARSSDEDTPFYPFGKHLPYGHSKLGANYECLKAAAQGQDVVIATSCAILGPHDYKPSRMGKALLDFAHGSLHAYIPGGFEFVSMRDVVEGHLLAMAKGRGGHNYIFSSAFLSVDQLMDVFAEVTGHPKPRLRLPAGLMAGLSEISSFLLTRLLPNLPQRLTPGAVRILRMERHIDTRKAQEELGFTPTSIVEAIREAHRCFERRGLIATSPGNQPGSIPHPTVMTDTRQAQAPKRKVS